jgi:hypothetical protein
VARRVNYGLEKRQKEAKRKKKQEAKLEKKRLSKEANAAAATANPDETAVVSEIGVATPDAETPA